MNYADFQQQSSSEKIVLVKARAAKRLIAWSLESGSIYKITNFDFPVVHSISDSGTLLTEVFSLGSVTAGKFFNDRTNKIIYLRTSDSVNPNSKFLTMFFWNFFSNVGISASYDLNTGRDVYWLPFVRSTSDFGNELDNEDQIGLAIEGAGQVVLALDRDYWDTRFEQWVWDNQPLEVYSWSRDLPVTEAKYIYKGLIVGKAFSSAGITLKVKDQVLKLKEKVIVDPMFFLAGARVPDSLLNAKQRTIYGRVDGYRPTNIDQEVDGYLLTGTISTTSLSATVTGSGTSFLNDLSMNDEIFIDVAGELNRYTIKSIASNTSLELTEAFELTLSGQDLIVASALPKNYINRTWLVAGHECNQPTRTVSQVISANTFYLNSVLDIKVGDDIFIGTSGSGEVATVARIAGTQIKLAQNLVLPPTLGTSVIRPCVQNLRWNDKKLIYDRDYVVSISSGKTYIILNTDFEFNLRSVRQVNGNVNFTNGSRAVTGSGTQFTKQLEPEGWIRSVGQFDFFQILSIESDTALTLKTPAVYTQTDGAQYLGGQNLLYDSDILTCEVTGKTDTGLYTGELLSTGSDIVKSLLADAGITNINTASFAKSKIVAPYTLGLAIPDTYLETSTLSLREILNRINISIFGSLVNNEDFEFEFNILRPNKPPTALMLDESDILSLSIESTNERVVNDVLVYYRFKEIDYTTLQEKLPLIYEKASDVGNYLVQAKQTKEVNTLLFYEDDARILANRWAFLLEVGTNVMKIETKAQGFRLQVDDVVKISHEKLFDRIGGGKVKYAAIQSIKKNGLKTILELDDLSNMFNRVGIIAETGSPDFNNSIDAQKQKHGFITDTYGLINNAENTFGLNLIW